MIVMTDQCFIIGPGILSDKDDHCGSACCYVWCAYRCGRPNILCVVEENNMVFCVLGKRKMVGLVKIYPHLRGPGFSGELR